jgi:ribonuclease Z
MRICLLGTGTPMPDPHRCGSGTAIIDRPTGAWLLVDCGRGVTQRAMEAGLDLGALRAVLLTHHHTDHISDLATLAITRFVGGAATPLRVVVPEGPCRRFAEACLDAYDDQAFYSQRDAGSSARPEIDVEAFAAGASLTTVVDDHPWTVGSVLVEHHPIEAAVGYRIDDGTAVLAVSGDTTACPGVAQLADHADVLVHEALRSDLVSRAALEWNASARSVGALAAAASVRHLVLTHLLPAPAGPADERAFVDEARQGGYGGPISIAHDLDRLDLPTST